MDQFDRDVAAIREDLAALERHRHAAEMAAWHPAPPHAETSISRLAVFGIVCLLLAGVSGLALIGMVR